MAISGDVAPGTGGATFSVGCHGGLIFDEPMVNEKGDVAFHACFTGGFGVFLKRDNKPLSLIARTGDFVRGVGILSADEADFDGPKINDKGTVLFVVRNITAGTTTAAVFQKKIGKPLKAILKQGDPAPGTNGGVFDDFDDMDQNNLDDAAIIAQYTEDGGATFKAGVFLIQNNGIVVRIIRDGNTLPGTNGGKLDGSLCVPGRCPMEAIDGPWLNVRRNSA